MHTKIRVERWSTGPCVLSNMQYNILAFKTRSEDSLTPFIIVSQASARIQKSIFLGSRHPPSVRRSVRYNRKIVVDFVDLAKDYE